MRSCFVIAVIACHAFCWGRDDAMVFQAMDRYAFDQWRVVSRREYPHPVSNLEIGELDLPTNGAAARISSRLETSDGYRLFVFQDGEILFRVRSRILPTLEEAHRAVLRTLSGMARPVSFLQTTNDTGDVLFIHDVPGASSLAVFARNNVWGDVLSNMPSCSATNIARQIDAAILRASGVQAE